MRLFLPYRLQLWPSVRGRKISASSLITQRTKFQINSPDKNAQHFLEVVKYSVHFATSLPTVVPTVRQIRGCKLLRELIHEYLIYIPAFIPMFDTTMNFIEVRNRSINFIA